jgi:hypothetical protein
VRFLLCQRRRAGYNHTDTNDRKQNH